MFIPKPVLFILFFVAIVSTGGLLYLLSQHANTTSSVPHATNTVLVSPSVLPSMLPSSSSPSAAPELASNAEWKTATQSSLSVKLEYPATWSLSATESGVLRITSSASTSSAPVVVEIRRKKKERSSELLSAFLSERLVYYKKEEYASKNESSYTVADYAGTDRLYEKSAVTVREIAFATKNYFYLVTIIPGQGTYTAVVEEILKSIAII